MIHPFWCFRSFDDDDDIDHSQTALYRQKKKKVPRRETRQKPSNLLHKYLAPRAGCISAVLIFDADIYGDTEYALLPRLPRLLIEQMLYR